MSNTLIAKCVVCGSDHLAQSPVLWPALIAEWRLSLDEAAYIERQQGLHCDACGTNLRSMALAAAMMRAAGIDGGVTFHRFVTSPGAAGFRVLEVNACGELGKWLNKIPGHELAEYPAVKMEELPYGDETFHFVVHSDTLEHVERPVHALSECRRVLKNGGACVFTVPVIVGRRTSTREGLEPSYHQGPSAEPRDEAMRVRTEYGADVWTQVVEAGFAEARVVALEYPAGLAVVGVR